MGLERRGIAGRTLPKPGFKALGFDTNGMEGVPQPGDDADEIPEITEGSIIRYGDPYSPVDGGVYTHGLVTEIISRAPGPDDSPRHIGTIPFNPRDGTLFIKDNDLRSSDGIPETVDFNVDVEDVTHVSHPVESRTALDAESRQDGFVQSLPRDTYAMLAELSPALTVYENDDVLSSVSILGQNTGGTLSVVVTGSDSPEFDRFLRIARQSNWTVTDRQSLDDTTQRVVLNHMQADSTAADEE